MTRLEVRCCCRPEKVLGTLPVDHVVIPGEVLTFSLIPAGKFRALASGTSKTAAAPARISFDVARWSTLEQWDSMPEIVSGVALRHENVDLETLRRIPGFKEFDADVPESWR